MPIFAKVLLFFSVPVILFSVLALPSLRKSKPKPTGDAWMSLASGGVTFEAQEGTRVEDPLTTGIEQLEERWAMGFPKRDTHAAFFFAGDRKNGFQAYLFVGPTATLKPMFDEANTYYRDNVMIERDATKQWKLLDGTAVSVESARYLPGPLTGNDATMLLASATKGDRMLLVNAGGPTSSFDVEQLKTFLATLRLGD